MRATPAATLVVAMGAALAGCGQAVPAAGGPPVETGSARAVAPDATPDAEERNLVPDGYDGTFRGSGLVLEAPGEGPQLCLGGVADSFPPQCGGPVVVGWDWDAVDPGSYEGESGGVRWGAYLVTGSYDGEQVVMTAPAGQPEPDVGHRRPSPDFSAPCPEPAGGWGSSGSDVARQQDDLQQAAAVAEAVDGYSALWLDRRTSVGAAGATEDPADLVLVVTTAGDTDLMRERVASVWDGALCVAAAPRTAAEVEQVQQEVGELPGLLFNGRDAVRAVVQVQLTLATQAQQDALDARYGPGVVELSGALEPVGAGRED